MTRGGEGGRGGSGFWARLCRATRAMRDEARRAEQTTPCNATRAERPPALLCRVALCCAVRSLLAARCECRASVGRCVNLRANQRAGKGQQCGCAHATPPLSSPCICSTSPFVCTPSIPPPAAVLLSPRGFQAWNKAPRTSVPSLASSSNSAHWPSSHTIQSRTPLSASAPPAMGLFDSMVRVMNSVQV